MSKLILSQDEIADIDALLRELTVRYGSSEDPDLITEATIHAHELPRRLRAFLNGFRVFEPASGACVVSGFPVDDERIGRTPEHWKTPAPSPTLREEIFLVLCGSLLGDLIAWMTQQDGALVHNILPVRGHEGDQLGIGCEQPLDWHIEDAFHPYRGDYLALLCLRNQDHVPTTLGPIDRVRLDPELRERLFETSFVIRPDESHLPRNNQRPPDGDSSLRSAFERIEKMQSEPEKVAVLFGSATRPYVRIDPYWMDEPADEPARRALKALVQAIDDSLEDVTLEPGEILIVDNFRAVHGRRPFRARYDGRDRWLKRINIARDLRKSRQARAEAVDRVIV